MFKLLAKALGVVLFFALAGCPRQDPEADYPEVEETEPVDVEETEEPEIEEYEWRPEEDEFDYEWPEEEE